ncbi:recombinase family protein [Bacillus sp. MUM 13]|uniref:recombinase family protein n=1 Tax=Bacillus sp. MUM 13 TaxID=1678001 RepID=UPI0008F57F31|nr:recombinase family protein [Bacillus sp. MUM 13]OIK10061.1 hypothetical protein BIV59_15105 [Bacillus sp. MUM 13]
MGRIIPYYRKSITVKGLSDEESVSYQSSSIQNYAEKNNHVIVKEFTDVGYTGSNTNRPELKEMLQYLEENPNTIDEVVLYSIDRLGRDLGGNINTFLTMEKYVDRIYFLSENIDSNNQFFKVHFLIWTAVAEDTKKQLLERTSKGKQTKTINERVFVNGKFAIGYTKGSKQHLVAATRQNTMDIQERTGLEIVQFIYYAYLFGMSLRQIAKQLNQHFGLTRYYQAEWSHKTVRYVLQNQTYCGVLSGNFKEGNKEYFIEDANIEVLVDPLLFEVVQQKLKYGTVGRRKKRNISITHYLVCENCATILQLDGNVVKCLTCNIQSDSVSLLNDIQCEIETYIVNNIDFNPNKAEVMEGLLNRYSERKNLIVQKMERLNVILKEIDELESYIPQKRLDNMRSINQNETCSLMKQLYFEEARIRLIRSLGQESIISDLKPYLLMLPYVVIINLETNTYNLLFCQYEAKGGEQY